MAAVFLPLNAVKVFADPEGGSPATYTVTFDANGHGTAPDAQTVESGTTATKPADPTETGWSFEGWYTDKACSDGKEFDFYSGITEDTVLYAKWLEGITVTIDFGEKHEALAQSLSGTAGLTVSGSKVSFVTGSGKSINDIISQFVYSKLPLDFEIELMNANRIDNGEKMHLGWWYLAPNPISEYTSDDQIRTMQNNLITEDTTLYVLWDKPFDGEVTVTVSMPEVGSNVVTKNYGSIASDYSSPGPVITADGATFESWSFPRIYTSYNETTDSIGSLFEGTLVYNTDYYVVAYLVAPFGTYLTAPNTVVTVNGVEQVWFRNGDERNSFIAKVRITEENTVTFDANGHGTAPDAQIIAYGEKATEPQDPAETGYIFEGWYTNKACTTEYDFNTEVKANVTLYAKWTPVTYTVSFDANGHGTAPAAQSVDHGNTAEQPSDPSSSGFTFGGWYTDAACTNAYSFSTAVTADITLYAKWTAESTPTPTPVTTPTPAPTTEPSGQLLTGGMAHIQDIGDTTVSVDPDTGILTIGTTGQGKRLEAITIYFENTTGYEGTMMYRVHVQDIGWMDWVEAGNPAGTTGQSKRIEAIEIKLTGELADYYSVEYCVHIQDYGDMQGWVKDGALAGTTGESKRIEQINIRVVPMGGEEEMSVKYRVHIQDIGWESSYASDGAMSGTSGQSKRLEGIEIFLSGTQYGGGIKYKTHIQDIGWESSWSQDGEMSGTQGQSKRLEAISIELYGEVAEYYDIYYRVHAQDIGWMGWAKNGEYAGTAGRSARLEGIQIVLVPKGSPAPETPAYVEGF